MNNLSRNRTNPQATLKQIDRLAWLLDNSIRIPILNYRIGLDALIGLIPGLGDVAGMLLSSFIVWQAIRLGTPMSILSRMVLNIGIEALLGLIPILGDIFDATFKANVRNVQLLNSGLSGRPTNRAVPPIVNKSVLFGILGALLVLIVLVGWAGVALLSWFVSMIGR